MLATEKYVPYGATKHHSLDVSTFKLLTYPPIHLMT